MLSTFTNLVKDLGQQFPVRMSCLGTITTALLTQVSHFVSILCGLASFIFTALKIIEHFNKKKHVKRDYDRKDLEWGDDDDENW